MINEKYPEEWLQAYTNCFKIKETVTGAGIYCLLFPNYIPVATYKTNFNGEIEAIHFAVQQRIYRLSIFQNTPYGGLTGCHSSGIFK